MPSQPDAPITAICTGLSSVGMVEQDTVNVPAWAIVDLARVAVIEVRAR